MFSLFSILCISGPSDLECNRCKRHYAGISRSMHGAKSPSDFAFCKGNKRCEQMTARLNKVFANHTSPDVICESLGKCRPKAQALAINPRKLPCLPIELHESWDNCEYCTSLIDYLTGEGTQDVAVPVFRKLFDKVCEKAEVIASYCSHINDHHINIMINLIAAKFENTELCGQAGFCSTQY